MSLFRRAAIKALSTSSPSATFASRSYSSSIRSQKSLPSALAPRARQTTISLITRRTYSEENKSVADSAYESVTGAAEKVKETVSSGYNSVASAVSSQGRGDRRYDGRSEGRNDRRPERRPVQDASPNPNLYIGNLYFEVTEETLKKEFEKYGSINSVKIIYDGRGLSKGFGYIEFGSTEEATEARNALDGQVVEGRRIAVQYAISKAGGDRAPRRTANAAGFTNPPSKTLFIGNMSYEMSDKDLNDLFRDVKNVLDVRVAIDRRTGQPRGFAHADFIDTASAEEAATYLKSKEFYGRNLRIDFSTSSTATGTA